MSAKPITVISIDDHPLIREAIRGLLAARSDMELVGEGWAGEHLFPLMEQYRPDVLILDLRMPHYADNGSEERFAPLPALAQLQEAYPQTAVIIFSQYGHHSLIQSAVDNGVRGYLLKDDNLSLNLASAIEAVHNGGLYFSQAISQQLFQAGERQKAGERLSPRQLEAILAIAKAPDASYAQIADSLHITESTLKGHLNKAYKALDVTNITACIIRCVEYGLISFSFDEKGRIQFGE